MPKDFKSLLYTVQLLLVLVVNTLVKTLNLAEDVNKSGMIALSVVLLGFILFIIFKSFSYVDTKQKNIILWGGSVVIIIGVVVLSYLIQGTSIEKFSLVFGIFIAFLVNYASNKWLKD